jgi:hypothetical protein
MRYKAGYQVRCVTAVIHTWEHVMAKGNRENKKPKKVAVKTVAAAESLKGGGPKMMPALGAGKKK